MRRPTAWRRDIQRYLADEPVEARPPSAGYRLRKFVRRHKGQVIAASLVLLAVGGWRWPAMRGATDLAALIREAKANVDLKANAELTRRERRPGTVRPGGRCDQDVPHRGQRGLPAQGGEIPGAAQPAAEVGQRLLRQARRPARQGDGPGLTAGAGAGQLRAGRTDRQGRQTGGRAGGPPAGPRRPRGAGGRIAGRSRDQGRSGAQPDCHRRLCLGPPEKPRRRRQRTARQRPCWSN